MEDKDPRGYVAEFLGTFFMVFLTAATVSANVRGDGRAWMVVAVALAAAPVMPRPWPLHFPTPAAS